MSCRQRVWASGDQDDCGRPTFPGNTYCIEHRVYRLNTLQQEIKSQEEALADLKREYEALLKEGQPA